MSQAPTTLRAEAVRSPEPAPIRAVEPARGRAVALPLPPDVVEPARSREVPPPPPPDSDAADRYSLLLVPAHNSRAAAERLRHYVDRRGHYAVVEAVGPPGGRQYRVRILGLPDLDAALETGSELRGEHLTPTIVPPG
jgi:hypothetical protein